MRNSSVSPQMLNSEHYSTDEGRIRHLRTQRKGATELIEQSVSGFCRQFYGPINRLNLSKAYKCWLIGKDPDAGRDWGQEEKGTTEDEMAGWHHWLDGCESEWTLGVGDGQGGLVCCDSWGRKESDMTERLSWTEGTHMQILTKIHPFSILLTQFFFCFLFLQYKMQNFLSEYNRI